jgi:hypothetical protein
MEKHEPQLDIDEFIRRTNSLDDMKKCVQRMLNNVDISDTIILAHAYPHKDGSGHLELATHGSNCGAEHIIRELAKHFHISLMHMALEEIMQKIKRNDND